MKGFLTWTALMLSGAVLSAAGRSEAPSDRSAGQSGLSAVRTVCSDASARSASQEAVRLTPSTVDAVVARMTLEEKARMLNGAVSESQYGWGFVANAADYVAGAAGPTVEYPQYGIPRTIFADGPAGLRISPRREGVERTFYCTAFPVGTLLASTWDTETVKEVGAAMGDEVLEYGVDALLGPSMNIQRNPLCGRNFEYLSEDPLVSGLIAAAYVDGVQSRGVGACIKHFAANNQETNRAGNDVLIGERALREIYLRGYEIALRHSDPWIVMTSYNKINGTYCCEDAWLLEDVLRREWGFRGVVVTDWIGRRNTAAQVHAGNDLLMPGSERQIADIIEAVREGRLSEADVDRNVSRVLRYVTRTPHYNGYRGSDSVDLRAHARTARRAAADGMVLLKNDGALPLKDRGARIALYGLGSYSLIAGGTGSGHVNRAYTAQIDQGLQAKGFSIDAPLRDLYRAYHDYAWRKIECESAWVVLDFGHPALPEMPLAAEAVAARQRASDAAVVTIRRSAGETFDRTLDGDYVLSPEEETMIRDVCREYHRAGKPVVVVLNIDAPIDLSSWRHLPDAILCAWLPGQEGGNAVADILAGDANPSGRLPMTFARRYEDHASSRNFPVAEQAIPQPFLGFPEPIPPRTAGKDIDSTRYEEGIYVGYRHFDKAAIPTAYPFGHGLSYTSFSYGRPQASYRNGVCRIACEVTNTGAVAGREVVQLYAAAPAARMEKPVKELRAFCKTRELKPGESQTVVMEVPVEELASFDERARAWVAESGTYRFMLAASAEDIRQTAEVKVPAATRPVRW